MWSASMRTASAPHLTSRVRGSGASPVCKMPRRILAISAGHAWDLTVKGRSRIESARGNGERTHQDIDRTLFLSGRANIMVTIDDDPFRETWIRSEPSLTALDQSALVLESDQPDRSCLMVASRAGSTLVLNLSRAAASDRVAASHR